MGLSFFALNYPSRGRGRDSKDCFPTGASFFDFNYPTPGVDNRKKDRRRAVLLVVCQWELWYNTLDTL